MHDLVILSDLHIGRGRNPETGRYHSLEAFFYDEDLRRFCQHLCEDARARGVPFKLILNGDVFDLLRVEPEEQLPGATSTVHASSPVAMARLLEQILVGHPTFVDAIALVLEAGHDVVVLPGNHDAEMQWEPLQAELRRALLARVAERAGAEAVEAAGAHLRFEAWFYHEPGRIWVEHGCQYDGESSFRYPLRSRLGRLDQPTPDLELDLPLGSFFQKYLYNAFGAITFIVPSTRANARYFRWLLINRPHLLARVAQSHGPFVWQFVRRMARSAGLSPSMLRANHESELAELAKASGLGQRLLTIDGLKYVRHDAVNAIRTLGWQLVKFAALSSLVAMAATGLWYAGFHAINQLKFGFVGRATLFLLLNFIFIAAVAVGVGYSVFRSPSSIRAGSPIWPSARQIAELLDVPIVTFGHTHDEALWPLDLPSGKRAWYYNTGTWIAVFTHDELMPREQVQFTFLRVRGKQGELLQWDPALGEPRPVILLDS